MSDGLADPRGLVCVFAKPPRAGEVKTRLIPAVGAGGASDLARAFLIDTCDALRDRRDVRGVLATSGALDDELAWRTAMPIWPQGDGDLGARMARVIDRGLATAPWAIAVTALAMLPKAVAMTTAVSG